jgi:tetratricopeptide (TPR) repeat protein
MRNTMGALAVVGLLLAAAGWLVWQFRNQTLRAAEHSYRAGRYEHAAQLYLQASKEGADTGHALFNRAAALYELGRYQGAAQEYKAQAEGIRSARSRYDQGNCLLQQACGTPEAARQPFLEQAIDCYQKCLDRKPAEGLAANARHNQELARKLLARSQADAGSKKHDQGQDGASKQAERQEARGGQSRQMNKDQQAKAEQPEQQCPT